MDLHTTTAAIAAAMAGVIEGKPEVIRLAITALLAEGHLLIEDVPGVGKTMLAKTLAHAIGASARRIQFTPDLLPSDITGVNIFDQEHRRFVFRPGAVFAQVVVADEINRASPKTQSALLEAMEEGQVTVDGTTHPLPDPFMVMATQNPLDMEGTYPLPEAQRDRFLARIGVGYPSPQAQIDLLDHHGAASPLDDLEPVAAPQDLARLTRTVRRVHAAEAVRRYIVDLAEATRSSPDLRLGVSPRATLHLLRAARATAALQGRGHVLPDDVRSVVTAVWSHRVILSAQALSLGRRDVDVLTDLLARTPVPGLSRPR